MKHILDMEPYQDRVITESIDLQMKVISLENFMKGDEFPELSVDAKNRLEIQLVHMKKYFNVLQARIGNFMVGGDG